MMRVVVLLLLLLLNQTASAVSLFKGAISLELPKAFFGYDALHDPGDDPFSGNGPGFEFLSNGGNGQINIQVSVVGFTVGEGKRVTYDKITAKDLSRLMEQQWNQYFIEPHRAVEFNQSGLQGARLYGTVKMAASAPYRTDNLQETWLQIQTNIVLKISARAPEKELFRQVVQCISTLKIDRQKLLEALKPKEPKVSKSRLVGITSGYLIRNNKRSAAFLFRTPKDSLFFVSEDLRNPDEIVQSMDEAVADAKKHQKERDVSAQVVFYSSRIGKNTNDVQRSCSFEFWDTRFADGASQEQILKSNGKFYVPHKYPNDDFWVQTMSFSGLPQNFRKEKEYTLNFDMFFWMKE